MVAALATGDGPAAATGSTTAPFNECPTIGVDTSCGLLVNVTSSGATYTGDPTQGPYESVDDTLIGVLNSTASPLASIHLQTNTDAFLFGGDGICYYGATNSSGACFGPTGYEGPGTSFTNVDPTNHRFGDVVFTPPLAPGASTYFGLEERITASSFTRADTTIATTSSDSVPAGGVVSDTAVVTSPAPLSGTVTFSLYGPGDTACTSPLASVNGTLAGQIATSGPVTVGAAGVYNWVARYNGDILNNPVKSACGSEPVTVTPQVLYGRAYVLAATGYLSGTSGVLIAPVSDTGTVVSSVSTSVSPHCAVVSSAPLEARLACSNVTIVGYPAKSTASASLLTSRVNIHSPITVPLIVLKTLTSTATTTCGGSTGSATIAYLKIGSKVVISTDTVIAPNTVVSVPGLARLVLDEQIVAPDGHSITVNAVHLTVGSPGGTGVDVIIASSSTGVTNCP